MSFSLPLFPAISSYNTVFMYKDSMEESVEWITLLVAFGIELWDRYLFSFDIQLIQFSGFPNAATEHYIRYLGRLIYAALRPQVLV